MTPPDGYRWHQRDALELRCEACGDLVRAEIVDLHERGCRGRC